MKTLKKLLVWGAFIAMAFVVAGCEEEEEHFDSVVDVEETSLDGLGDGSGESSGGVHVVKNSVGDAVSDLFFGGGEDDEQESIAYEAEEENGETVTEESGEENVATAVEAQEEQPAENTVETPSPESPVSDSSDAKNSNSDTTIDSAKAEEGAENEKVSADKAQKEEVADAISEESMVQEEVPQIVEEEESVDIDISLLIINEAKTRFGMVAIMDPYTKEQVLIGALNSEEMYVLEMTWPSKEKHLRIAVYDENGNIVKEDSIDFKHISAGGVITLKGEGSLSDISSEIK